MNDAPWRVSGVNNFDLFPGAENPTMPIKGFQFNDDDTVCLFEDANGDWWSATVIPHSETEKTLTDLARWKVQK